MKESMTRAAVTAFLPFWALECLRFDPKLTLATARFFSIAEFRQGHSAPGNP